MSKSRETKWPAALGVPQKMEVILTLSNRISLAGALPIVVALVVCAVAAAIMLAPTTNVSADADPRGCELSADLLDALLDRFDMAPTQCDDMSLANVDAATIDVGSATVWDFSDRGWTEFGISAADAEVLMVLTDTNDVAADADGTGPVVEATVRYIDLTGNDISIEDVDFSRIPRTVAIILDGATTGVGFQAEEYTVTEGSAGYVSVAFPGVLVEDDEFEFDFVVSGGDSTDALNAGLGGNVGDTNATLISVGGAATTRDAFANSDSESKIFYYPLNVGKDNTTNPEWDFTLAIDDTAANLDGFTSDFDSDDLDDVTITVLDADAPEVSVCDRSDDVEDWLVAYVSDATVNTTNANPDNDDCDEITTRDLNSLTGTLTFSEFGADADDELPMENLIAGDFQGLSDITSLVVRGARSLPSGIFDGVGSGLEGDATVTISFAQNTSDDPDDEKAGKYSISTIPSHIWENQEPQQVIVVNDDLDPDDDTMGVTKGLNSSIYPGVEGGHIWVITPYTTNAWTLGTMVTFPLADVDPIVAAVPSDPQVVRFAIELAQEDDADDVDDDTAWLFLFDSSTAANAGSLLDYAVVLISDDD